MVAKCLIENLDKAEENEVAENWYDMFRTLFWKNQQSTQRQVTQHGQRVTLRLQIS